MKSTPTLIESLLPVRSRLVRDESVGSYDIPSQTRQFSVDGRLLPFDVRASDGGTDGTKIADKITDKVLDKGGQDTVLDGWIE